ncbi:DUF4240 domain-containing protein [Actinokineospora inagensis]|uniref:DUF4240 domain-containing protein n=1 Tax=Actinokineospora inagensis TaxID=103730 RepID=UPI00040A144F|nr:DUF4240 domain-containing protein [Actinokineospora inagensis]
MTEDAFWQLLARAAEQPGDRDERADWLAEELTRLGTDEVTSFARHLAAATTRANTWPLLAAAALIEGGRSDDAFWYFRLWLVGLGRTTFDAAVGDPDTLADLPAVRALASKPSDEWSDEDWPEWESLDYAAPEAHQELTGAEGGLPDIAEGAPTGQEFDVEHEVELRNRLPRLTALFG